MDTVKLFIGHPRNRINLFNWAVLAVFSEQTYRNLFEHENSVFGLRLNSCIISKYLTGKRKAIAMNASLYPQIRARTALDVATLVWLCRIRRGNHGSQCH